MKAALFFLLLYCFGNETLSAKAQDIPPPAYQIAAAYTGIPSAVLYAIALQESGRSVHGKLLPWPWTLNIAGKGYYFDSSDSACRHLSATLKTTPAKRVDVGLGQINIGYHGHRVRRPCDLLNPYLNLAIAGQILLEQHKPGQDWLVTMGKYHSPANGNAAVRYRNSIRHHLLRVQGQTSSPSAALLP